MVVQERRARARERSIDSIDSISHGVGGYCAAAVFVRWGNVSCRGTERSRGVNEDEGAGRIAQERETRSIIPRPRTERMSMFVMDLLWSTHSHAGLR